MEWLLAVPCATRGTAWDVAYGVLYLASDEAKFVNATELVIDGGQTASTTGRVWEG
jgi:NAD(P)-dependent dehydrogenase (short-subunit alcohol dehydrogenase family)